MMLQNRGRLRKFATCEILHVAKFRTLRIFLKFFFNKIIKKTIIFIYVREKFIYIYIYIYIYITQNDKRGTVPAKIRRMRNFATYENSQGAKISASDLLLQKF